MKTLAKIGVAGSVAVMAGIGTYAWACMIGASTNFPCIPVSFNPANPAASGYQIVFQDTFADTSTIDMADTAAPGFHWYRRKPFGYTTEPAANIVISGGHLVLTTTANTAGIMISTAVPVNGAANGAGWVGTAFGNGAYFEAQFAFDGPSVYAAGFGDVGWPAFWGMSVEHWANIGGDQWPGQPAGYTHFIEDDFFEYDNTGNQNFWGTGIWDWSGTYAVTCPASGFCGILNDGRTSAHGVNNIYLTTTAGSPVWNTSTFHTLGHLWVHGDANNSQQGFTQTFMDGQAAITNSAGSSQVPWTHTTMPSPDALPGSPQVWNIHDDQKLVVVLGTGNNLPFHVKFVKVWQIPGCGTIAH
jgi:hypothetical protein